MRHYKKNLVKKTFEAESFESVKAKMIKSMQDSIAAAEASVEPLFWKNTYDYKDDIVYHSAQNYQAYKKDVYDYGKYFDIEYFSSPAKPKFK